MWDRLLVDCNIATMSGDALGVIENGAIGIADGKIVRVGKRTELAGFRAREVTALGGAWVTPGLVDCHTHLIFGGNRADEHAMRRAGATYEEIARAGGGIASTVKKTAAASDEELLASARARLGALAAGGCTTVEAKTGYGLDVDSELRLLRLASELGDGQSVRVVPTLLALHAIPADKKDSRAHYLGEIIDKLIPAAAKTGATQIVDAYCDTIAFTPEEVERLFKAAAAHGLRVRLHAEQLSNQKGAALAAQYRALSADHLEHLDEEGAAAMAAAGTIAVLLPGAFYALQETRKPPVDLLRKHKVPCQPGRRDRTGQGRRPRRVGGRKPRRAWLLDWPPGAKAEDLCGRGCLEPLRLWWR
jgi:imidazolonepropionase